VLGDGTLLVATARIAELLAYAALEETLAAFAADDAIVTT